MFFVAGNPTGVDMDRVARAKAVIDEVESDHVSLPTAVEMIDAIAQRPPMATGLFALAAGAGAVALAGLFSIQHLVAAAIIFASSTPGAALRRAVSHQSGITLLQPFCAALLAGLIGALAVLYHLSSSLRLVAVCPCMILVPGPHFLNAMIDLSAPRISLGTSRLIYACLIVIAISFGLLLGLAVLGVFAASRRAR